MITKPTKQRAAEHLAELALLHKSFIQQARDRLVGELPKNALSDILAAISDYEKADK